MSKQPIPCEDCESVEWDDWTLLPHEEFNKVCPGGNGYLCLPCFSRRLLKLSAPADNEALRSYKEYDKFITGVFAAFEIAVLDYAYDRGIFSERTLTKRIDAARRDAFEKVARHIQAAEHDQKVADNCRNCANATLPATWVDPVTGNKLHNLASLNAATTAARIDEQERTREHKDYGGIFYYYDDTTFKPQAERITELRGEA